MRGLTPAGTQRCPRCALVLPVGAFHSNVSTKSGRSSYCRGCRSTFNVERRKALAPDLAKEIGKRLYARRKPKLTPEYRRQAMLKFRYGVSIQRYEAMLVAQGGRCAICGRSAFDSTGRRLCVDHDHGTGRVRGLLCMRCNRGIGHFEDSVTTIRAALKYLEAAVEVRGGGELYEAAVSTPAPN